MKVRFRFVLSLIGLSIVLVGCSAVLNSCGGGGEQISAVADLDNVFIIRADDTRESLPAKEQGILDVGEGVDVDENGRAILQFADLLTVEVLRDGALTIKQLDVDEQTAAITVFQNGGVLLNDFNAEEAIERRFTIDTEFASISAVGTQFLVVQEPNSPLEWVLALSAAPGDLEVTSNATGQTKDVQTNVVRWVAPIGEPSAGIQANINNVVSWIQSSQTGNNQDNFGDIVWAPADVLADGEELAVTAPQVIPEPGAIYTYQGVDITLGSQGQYAQEDCNLDGIPDIRIQGGGLEMDFRNVLARVKALDVTVLVDGGMAKLTVFDPAHESIETQSALAAPELAQVLSLRHDEPYHYAELTLDEGCFLGFSLTPPATGEQPETPRAAVDQLEVATDFVRITEPFDGATVTAPLVISGEATVPLYNNRELLIRIETPDGNLIQQEGVVVEGGEPGGAPGTFSRSIELDYVLPAEVVVRVQNIEPVEFPIILAEDSVQITLNPASPNIVRRPPDNGEFFAPYVPTRAAGIGPDFGMVMDADFTDWAVVSRTYGIEPTRINRIVYDAACHNFSPLEGADIPLDLEADVMFAFNDDFLFAYFRVWDERYVAYSLFDTLIFQGDAPQIILDTDLAGDFDTTTSNQDDIEIDLFPGNMDGLGLYSPYAAYWNIGGFLQSGVAASSYIAKEVQIAGFGLAQTFSVETGPGYTVEAAIPWEVIGIHGSPGDIFGIAASVSDNDTPDTDVQECMISSAPGRDFRNPATWGTLFLMEAP